VVPKHMRGLKTPGTLARDYKSHANQERRIWEWVRIAFILLVGLMATWVGTIRGPRLMIIAGGCLLASAVFDIKARFKRRR
jgi:hypothetical protein